MHDIYRRLTSVPGLIGLATLQACGPAPEAPQSSTSRVDIELIAHAEAPELAEISGMETRAGPRFLVHNDDGRPEIFVLDSSAAVVSRFHIEGAKNRDWEDLTWVPGAEGRWLAIGDIGDNQARRKSVRVYFVDVPASEPADNGEAVPLRVHHVVKLRYPDGPRDSEAMAYDSSSSQILLMTKRDKPPRLYGADAAEALKRSDLQLEFLGTAPRFRPPTRDDMRRLGKEGAFVSQPTGMDINDDGSLAAVITYRSLYLFERQPDEPWVDAFNRAPREFLGPRSNDEEAVAFGPDMGVLYITAEGHPAPLYRVALPAPE